MTSKGIQPTTRVISFAEVEASEEVAEALSLEKEDKVYSLVRLRFGDNNPVVIVTTYLPKKYLPDLMEYDFDEVSLYSVLEELGYGVRSISRTLEITFANELTSELLNINMDDPLFYFKSIGRTTEKIPVEYSIARYRSDLNTFRFEVELE